VSGDHGGWTCGFGDSSREEKGEQSAERCASLADTPACSNLPRVHIASFALIQDWELCLRSSCQKIRVVERVAGDADMLVTGSPSVAV